MFAILDESDSGTGPTISDGQMVDFSFSRCTVSSRPVRGDECESRDENEEVILGWAWPGETEREATGLGLGSSFRRGIRYRPSSANERLGEESTGDGEYMSSASDACALSSEAAKLLEMSGSEETNAYEEWVDAVEAEEIVRSRGDWLRVDLGSSCHTELAVSTGP